MRRHNHALRFVDIEFNINSHICSILCKADRVGASTQCRLRMLEHPQRQIQYEKKRPERRKHSALVVLRRIQKFSPRRRPPSRGAGRSTFNQLEMVITFTYSLQTQFGEDRCTQFRVIVVTDPPTYQPTNTARPPARPPATDRTDNNTLRR